MLSIRKNIWVLFNNCTVTRKTMQLPNRKPTRLRGYDYSTPGAYFVTICTYRRICILGNIVGQGLAPAEMNLSKYGEIVKEQLLDLENRYETIKIDKYVIMPNHIHIIMFVGGTVGTNTAGASPCPTISDVICSFKSLTTIACHKLCNSPLKIFQASFHDHIIRGEKDYEKIWEYIDTNVLKWENDTLYNSERP